MAFTLRASTGNATSTGTGASISSLSQSLAAAPAVGDVLIAVSSVLKTGATAHTTSVTSNTSNSQAWAEIGSAGAGSGVTELSIWWAVTSSTTIPSITANFDVSTSVSAAIVVFAVNPGGATPVLDTRFNNIGVIAGGSTSTPVIDTSPTGLTPTYGNSFVFWTATGSVATSLNFSSQTQSNYASISNAQTAARIELWCRGWAQGAPPSVAVDTVTFSGSAQFTAGLIALTAAPLAPQPTVVKQAITRASYW